MSGSNQYSKNRIKELYFIMLDYNCNPSTKLDSGNKKNYFRRPEDGKETYEKLHHTKEHGSQDTIW